MSTTTAVSRTPKESLVVSDGRKKFAVTTCLPRLQNSVGVVLGPETRKGWVVIPQWEELIHILPKGTRRQTFRWKPEHHGWRLVLDVYAALRLTRHITNKYGIRTDFGEKRRMETLRRLAQGMNVSLAELSGRQTVGEILRRTGEPAAIAESLLPKKPRNLPKLEALEQARKLGVGSDALRRPNAPAGMARTVALRNRADERFREIMRIDPHIRGRAEALLGMIHAGQDTVEAIEFFLSRLVTTNGFAPGIVTKRFARASELEFAAQELEALVWNPFREAALQTARDLRAARDLLRKGEVDTDGLFEVRNLLLKARGALAIKRLQSEIERIIFSLTDLAYWRARPLHTIRASIESLEERLRGTLASLVGIDETGFRKPVCMEAARHLEAARRYLAMESDPRWKKSYLETARHFLKKASAAL